MPATPDQFRTLASEIRALATRSDSPAELFEAAGRLLISAIDAGAFLTPPYAPFIAVVRQRWKQGKVNGSISAWAQAVWWLKGKPDGLPDAEGTFAEDCELVAARILESVGLPARTQDDELRDLVADADADWPGREFIDVSLWRITVPLPPAPADVRARRLLEGAPLTPQEMLEHERREGDSSHIVTAGYSPDPAAAEVEVTIRVRVFEGRAELDEADPSTETLNRRAWDRVQERYGRPVSLRLDQGRPVAAFADDVPIPGQRATRYGRRPEVSPADLIDRLSHCTYMPQLTDDELARLRAHLKTPPSLSRLQRDPAERARRAKLREVLTYNDELRQAAAESSKAPPARTDNATAPGEAASRPVSKPVDGIPLTWLRAQVPPSKVKGDSSKLAAWLRRRKVPVYRVAGKNYAERADLLGEFSPRSRVHQLIREYKDDGE